MEYESNHLNQPIGPIVLDWKPPRHPMREPMDGRFCRLEPLDPMRHAQNLYAANALDVEGRNWTYLPYGPDIAPDKVNGEAREGALGYGEAPERVDYKQILLPGRLLDALQRINPYIPRAALEEQVVHILGKPEHPVRFKCNHFLQQRIEEAVA